MKPIKIIILFFQVILSSSVFAAKIVRPSDELFLSSLQSIQVDYNVPGMTVSVKQTGKSGETLLNINYISGVLKQGGKQKITNKTMFPIASLTKVFSGHLILNLVNEGKLGLSDSVIDILPESNLPSEITIAHLLSHTLLGQQKNQFFYDQRYVYLTKVVSTLTKRKFEDVLVENIQQDFTLNNIIAYTPKSVKNKMLALGHVYDGGNTAIEHDFGISASAGLVSDAESLMSAGSQLMKTWKNKSSPNKNVFYRHDTAAKNGNGLFLQLIDGIEVYWGYGQYDGYASLWIMVPEKQLQLVMLANNNILSDASRLIFGDITTSPIYLAFAREFICKPAECSDTNKLQRSHLLKETYFSRYNKDSYQKALSIISKAFPQKRHWIDSGDLHLLHASSYLHAVSDHSNYNPPNWLESEGALLLSHKNINENRPYWLYYLANYYDRQGLDNKAKDTFRALISIPEMPMKHWTYIEAQQWLNNHSNN